MPFASCVLCTAARFTRPERVVVCTATSDRASQRAATQRGRATTLPQRTSHRNPPRSARPHEVTTRTLVGANIEFPPTRGWSSRFGGFQQSPTRPLARRAKLVVLTPSSSVEGLPGPFEHPWPGRHWTTSLHYGLVCCLLLVDPSGIRAVVSVGLCPGRMCAG